MSTKRIVSLVLVFSFLLAGCSGPVAEETSSSSSSSAVCYSCPGETLRSPVIRNSSFDVPVADESSSSYSLVFTGSWDLVESEEYKEELTHLFYAVYPRICARWGDGTEPSTICLYADPSDDGVAYSSGETIGVSVAYANENPTDIGWFAHELAHSAFYFYSYLDWFEEILASYAGYRYFHNTSPSALKYIDLSCESVQSWYYEPYGEGVPFFAYLDYKYPTTGSSLGLLDSLVAAIDSGEIELEGDPLDPDTAFNSVVSSVTGCSTIEDLRLQFLADVESGDYSFDGFSSYRDNYLTSDIPGVPDISYVSLELPDLSSVPSASAVSGAVSYDNVFSSATVVRSSGYINEGEADSFLVDGSLDTKWCAESGNVTDVSYVVEGVEHFIVLDLGSEVAFDTYTVYNAGSVELSEWNMSSWELLVSSDGTTFYPVDYQESCAMDVASFDIGLTTARYVMLKVYDAEEDGGTVRLYELTAGMR